MDSSPTSSELPSDSHAAAVVLLRRIASDGDKDAFAELYDRFAGALFATILTIVRDRSEAEDTLQDCFCSIWDHADQFHASRGKAVSWMMTIARNKSFDHMAKRKRQGKISARIQEDADATSTTTQGDGFDTLAVNEESTAVRKALLELPEDQRQAIQLAFIQGMTQTEVAHSLDQPLGTVKARIRRGLYQMRGVLQPYLVDSTA